MKSVPEGRRVVVHLQATAGPGGLIPIAPGVYAHAVALAAMPDVDLAVFDGEPPVEQAPVRALRRRVLALDERMGQLVGQYRAKADELVEERARRYKERAETAARLHDEQRKTTLLRLVVAALRPRPQSPDDPDMPQPHPLEPHVFQIMAAVDNPCLSAYREWLYPNGDVDDVDDLEFGDLLHCVLPQGHRPWHLDQRGEEFTDTDCRSSPAEW